MAIMEKRRKEAEAKDNEKWQGGKGRWAPIVAI